MSWFWLVVLFAMVLAVCVTLLVAIELWCSWQYIIKYGSKPQS